LPNGAAAYDDVPLAAVGSYGVMVTGFASKQDRVKAFVRVEQPAKGNAIVPLPPASGG
jgi:hypothetical protein